MNTETIQSPTLGCPHCRTQLRQVKAGTQGGKQRYKCMLCLSTYTEEPLRKGYCDSIRQRALDMRSRGKTLGEIANILEVHPRTVGNWTRSYPFQISTPKAFQPEIVENGAICLDEQIAAPDFNTSRRPTRGDVANLAQVSLMTVSNYINNTGRLGEQTRSRIRRAMEELRFSVNPLIQRTTPSRTGIIGVGTHGLTTMTGNLAASITPLLLNGITQNAGDQKLNVMLFSNWERREGTRSWTEFLTGHIDGLLWVDPGLAESAISKVASTGFPVIGVLTRHVPDGVGYVNSDNSDGITVVVKHLFDLGHRRIAYAGQVDKSNYLDRWTGYRKGLEAVGLKLQREYEATGTREFWHPSKYIEVVTRWLQLKNRPTAMVMPDDRTAIVVINYLRQVGLRVPEDISVTGFDDIPGAEHGVAGGLTTVRQQFNSIGVRSVELLTRMIQGEPYESCRITVPVELIVRGSTGPWP